MGTQALESYRTAEIEETDWMAIILGVMALLSLLGLIPLWYLVYLRYTG